MNSVRKQVVMSVDLLYPVQAITGVTLLTLLSSYQPAQVLGLSVLRRLRVMLVGRGAGLVPGFGDQREIELLVEAGFSPVQAIQIATLNGATYMGKQNQIGSIAAGKNADLVVIKGDPATTISDIENVEIVFKDGVGYDSKNLIDSANGRFGQY